MKLEFLARINSSVEWKTRNNITHVIGLARGGLIPATIMSYASLDKPLLSLMVLIHMTVLPKTDKFLYKSVYTL